MPRPSRLSESDPGKTPADKEVSQTHPVRRLPTKPYRINLSETPLSERKLGGVQTQYHEGRPSRASAAVKLLIWIHSDDSKNSFLLEG